MNIDMKAAMDYFERMSRTQKIYCKCPDCDQEHTEKEAESVCDCGCIRCRIIFDVEDYRLI